MPTKSTMDLCGTWPFHGWMPSKKSRYCSKSFFFFVNGGALGALDATAGTASDFITDGIEFVMVGCGSSKRRTLSVRRQQNQISTEYCTFTVTSQSSGSAIAY